MESNYESSNEGETGNDREAGSRGCNWKTLHVRVLNLLMQNTCHSNLFVQLSLGCLTHTTKVKRADRQPLAWNADFTFQIKTIFSDWSWVPASKVTLVVQLHDHDKGITLGGADVDFTTLHMQEPETVEVPLFTEGVLTIEVVALDFGSGHCPIEPPNMPGRSPLITPRGYATPTEAAPEGVCVASIRSPKQG